MVPFPGVGKVVTVRWFLYKENYLPASTTLQGGLSGHPVWPSSLLPTLRLAVITFAKNKDLQYHHGLLPSPQTITASYQLHLFADHIHSIIDNEQKQK
jgi:hypothetical protein